MEIDNKNYMNLLQKYNEACLAEAKGARPHPQFRAGDTLRVHVEIVDGVNKRIQVFEGLCIALRNRGMGSSFTVRKISFGCGVERIFPLHSPIVTKVEITKRGRVRRAKLYYMRKLSGKKARLKSLTTTAPTAAEKAAATPVATA